MKIAFLIFIFGLCVATTMLGLTRAVAPAIDPGGDVVLPRAGVTPPPWREWPVMTPCVCTPTPTFTKSPSASPTETVVPNLTETPVQNVTVTQVRGAQSR